jgi:hypothetical protein
LKKGVVEFPGNASALFETHIFRPFSVLNVEPDPIPSIDSSLLIEQRIVAEQELAVTAVFA